MYKLIAICLICLGFTGCASKCKYNEYLPENNPLIIPEDLKPIIK